jgi:hypothetical protein
MCGHVPTPQGNQNDRKQAADGATDGFCALSVEFPTEARAELPADKPAECAAKNEAENSENGGADEQSDIIPGNCRADADRKETPRRTDSGASEGSYIRFTKGRFTHLVAV